MANPDRGELVLVSDGVRYTLRWTTNACAELESLSGHELQHWLDLWTAQGSHIAVRWLIWSGLQDWHADEIQTVEDAGRIIDGSDNLSEVLLAFIGLNFQPLTALLADGILKKPPEGQGNTRPPIAQAHPNGARGTRRYGRRV